MRNKTAIFIFIFQCLLVSGVSGKECFTLTLSEQWKFSTGDSLAWAIVGYDDSGWTTISSRRYWEEQGYNDYDGYAWYRQSFVISMMTG